MTMLCHYQNLVHDARPIRISRDDRTTGPRIGGNAPEGIFPSKIYPNTRYFLTLALDEPGTRELSLFTSLNYCEGSRELDLYQNISKIFSSEDFVQIVIHSTSKRGNSTELASELPGRALEIEPLMADVVVEPGGELLLPNKLGGRPYFYYGTRSYIDSINALYDAGFVLFLQLTWGGYERQVPFLWPFDQYTFHLLAKETSDGIIWRYGWG